MIEITVGAVEGPARRAYRRLRSNFAGMFFAVRGGGGDCVAEKTGRIDRVCCYTSCFGIRRGIPNTARTDDCLTAPNSLAPQGTRWYYHVDRTNQRKCWYVRATSQPAQQAAAQATSEAAPTAQSHSMPMSSGPMPATAAASAPMSISPGNSAPPLPHDRILVSSRSLRPPSAPQRTNLFREAGRKEVPGRQFRGPGFESKHALQTNAQAAGPPPAAPAAWPATVGAPEPGAVLADAGTESVGPKTDTQVPDRTESTARGGEPTINAGMAGSLTATPMLLTLALGLAAAGTVTRVVMKIAATRRAIAVFDHAETDWVDDQWQPSGATVRSTDSSMNRKRAS